MPRFLVPSPRLELVAVVVALVAIGASFAGAVPTLASIPGLRLCPLELPPPHARAVEAALAAFGIAVAAGSFAAALASRSQLIVITIAATAAGLASFADVYAIAYSNNARNFASEELRLALLVTAVLAAAFIAVAAYATHVRASGRADATERVLVWAGAVVCVNAAACGLVAREDPALATIAASVTAGAALLYTGSARGRQRLAFFARVLAGKEASWTLLPIDDPRAAAANALPCHPPGASANDATHVLVRTGEPGAAYRDGALHAPVARVVDAAAAWAVAGRRLRWRFAAAGVLVSGAAVACAAPALLRPAGPRELVADLAGRFPAVALDASDVYFVADDGRVMRVAKAGGTPTHVTALMLMGNESVDELVLDGDTLFVDTDRRILRVPKSGAAETTLVRQDDVGRVAFDGDDLIYVSRELVPRDGPRFTLRRIPKAGGASRELGPSIGCSDLVVDAGFVYEIGGCGAKQIVRTPVTGGAQTVLSSVGDTYASYPAFMLAGDFAYFSEVPDYPRAVLVRTRRDGTDRTVIARGLRVSELATDGTTVYASAVDRFVLAGGFQDLSYCVLPTLLAYDAHGLETARDGGAVPFRVVTTRDAVGRLHADSSGAYWVRRVTDTSNEIVRMPPAPRAAR